MVVIGAGPIGLMFMHVAELAGVKVIAVVKREDQMDDGEVVWGGAGGADRSRGGCGGGDAGADTRGRGADVVIEAVATPATWEWAVEMVRKGGVVNFFGGPPSGTKVELDTNRLHYGDITLKASFHHTPATCRTAFELVTEWTIQVRGVHHGAGWAGRGAGHLCADDEQEMVARGRLRRRCFRVGVPR